MFVREGLLLTVAAEIVIFSFKNIQKRSCHKGGNQGVLLKTALKFMFEGFVKLLLLRCLSDSEHLECIFSRSWKVSLFVTRTGPP
jgi:hypothetical protein